MSSDKQPDYLCFCNKVSGTAVSAAIQGGAKTLASIYDACGAGTGPCGGSCRPKILEILAEHLPAASIKSKSEIPTHFIEAISLFNRRYYWETHEVLEDMWMEELGERKLFYQGLIQAAAALYHVLNANPKGVIRLAEESIKKLSAYRPVYMDMPLEGLVETLEMYSSQSKEILGKTLMGFDYDKLPYLRIGNLMDQERPHS